MLALDTTGVLSALGGTQAGGRKVTAKALRRALKKAGLKTTGKKAALTRRAKKAHLTMRGGVSCAEAPQDPACTTEGGRRRRRGGAEGDACKTSDGKDGTVQVDGSCKAAVGGRRRSRKSRSRKH
jgi:hypothetical protein